MALPGRRSYSLRLRSLDQRDRVCILETSIETSLETSTEQRQSPGPTISADSAYFSPETSPIATELCPTRTRRSTWVSSLRSLLQKQKPYRRPRIAVPQGLCGSVTVPQNEDEVDRLLSDVWEKDVTEHQLKSSSQYVRKVTELKRFYDDKLSEIAQREATYMSELLYQDETTPLLDADHLNTDPALRKTLLETHVNYKFDELRFKLKQEVAQTILSLRAQYIDTGRKRRNLRPKATKLLNQWFERHLDHPYPSEQEKRQLATQCDISVEQVTNWFSNKRCRSKSLKTIRGRKFRAQTL